MSTNLTQAIESVLSHMNYDSAGRLKNNIPFQTKAGNPVVYEVMSVQSGMFGEPDYFTVHGYEIVESGKKVLPREAFLRSGAVWVGRSDLVWNDYSTSSGDGSPRFVVMANPHREQKYQEFHTDTANMVYSAVITISQKGVTDMHMERHRY